MDIILRVNLFSMGNPVYKVILKPVFHIIFFHKENRGILES
jgi:hypothetical protein